MASLHILLFSYCLQKLSVPVSKLVVLKLTLKLISCELSGVNDEDNF